ncbi:hypothetical protein SLA2020_204770 [Shorea laevis]
MAGAFNADTNLKSSSPTDGSKTVIDDNSLKLGFNPKTSIGTQKLDKGKKVVYRAKETNQKDKENASLLSPSTGEGSNSFGLNNQIINPSPSLEESLLSVKERIKNLEQNVKSTSASDQIMSAPKPSDSKSTNCLNGFTPIPSNQPQSTDSSCEGQQGDFNRGGFGSSTITREVHESIMEGGEAVQGMAQSPLDSQIDRPNSIPQLNTSFDGRFDNLNRSIQPTKARISQRRSKLRRDKGPYPISEGSGSNVVPTHASQGNGRQNGENSCHHQILNCAGDGETGSRMSSPPLSLLKSDIDANAQGNTSAAVQAGASQDGPGSN